MKVASEKGEAFLQSRVFVSLLTPILMSVSEVKSARADTCNDGARNDALLFA